LTAIVVVKKNGQVAIAADSPTTFGDTRLDIARAGVKAGIEFDKSSSAPFELHTLKLQRGVK
jgi:ATP-dependent protease HslVU (ClpYQ) peptidase subunit